MVNIPTRFLIWNVISLLAACHQPTQVEQLNQYLQTKHQRTLPQTGQLFILSEQGCPTCNKSFALLLEKFKEKENNLILISAGGSILDISSFIFDKAPNVLHDPRFNATQYGFKSNQSWFVNIQNNQIDTLLPMEAKTLKENLTYIHGLLEYH